MIEKLPRKILGGLLVAAYPVFVYLGLQYFDPRWVSIGLLIIIGIRLLSGQLPAKLAVAIAVVLFLTSGATLLTGSEFGLLLYPVLISVVFFTLFVSSLIYPPSMIEKIARLREPNLSPEGVAYTKNVTKVWVIFFLVNGTIAALTINLGREYWALYNGFISYLLMAVIFGVELLIRKRVKR